MKNWCQLLEEKRINKHLNKKAEVWKEIVSLFNSNNENGIKRDEKQIQNLWHNIKMQVKKDSTTKRRQIFLTGGGLAEENINPISTAAIEVMGKST